jgi:hypothetical protein
MNKSYKQRYDDWKASSMSSADVIKRAESFIPAKCPRCMRSTVIYLPLADKYLCDNFVCNWQVKAEQIEHYL